MLVTSGSKQRIKHDFYPTHSLLTIELLKRVDIRGIILEPCAGDGAIAATLRSHAEFDELWTNDIDLQWNTHFHFDATLPQSWAQMNELMHIREPPDWIATNPPYGKLTTPILQNAWNNCRIGVAFLLRINYVMEPCRDRADWLKTNTLHLSNVISFNPRPKFRADTKNTDNATVAWCVWRKNWDGGLKHGIEYITNWQK